MPKNIPTMAEKEITREQLMELAESIHGEALTKFYQYELSLDEVKTFLASVYDNYC